MAWSTTDPKYRSREHRELRAHYVRRIEAGEQLECTAVECVYDGEPITNTNGNDDDGLHLGHNDDGVTYAGPQHKACNMLDASRRGHAASRGRTATAEPRRWEL